MDGKEVIRHLREEWTIAPIIVISVRNEESEKVSSLDIGAHDYLTKPFSMPELLARMRATLRSVSATQDDVFTVRDLRVDLSRREVFVGETAVKLTATEYDLHEGADPLCWQRSDAPSIDPRALGSDPIPGRGAPLARHPEPSAPQDSP
jgi:DNA-binding response OmpR family regulator